MKNTTNRSKQLYGSYHGTQSYAQRRYDEIKECGMAQYVKGWRDMHFKGSSGWYNQLAEQHWAKDLAHLVTLFQQNEDQDEDDESD
ncbi:hypothetical protein R6Q57_007908 [Mikania cordata]